MALRGDIDHGDFVFCLVPLLVLIICCPDLGVVVTQHDNKEHDVGPIDKFWLF